MNHYNEIIAIKSHVLDQVEVFDIEHVTNAIEIKIATYDHLSLKEKLSLKDQVIDAIYHYDIIQPLLDDAEVSEIMINGPNKIFIEKKGILMPIDVQFFNREHLMQLVEKIAREIDRPINLSSPILDARLKDGSRVNVVLDPIADYGPAITIRKFGETLIDMQALMTSGMLDLKTSVFLSTLIMAKYNLFICGGTGTGKTTLLNCLSSCIPVDERLITIEDARELQLAYHQNLISLECRENYLEENRITMSHLIKTALRMRPNRIIVGEVRGEEVIDMIQAMNTGHDGSLSTGHGNSPMDMLMRLESIACHYNGLSGELVRQQVISAIDFVIHIERHWNGKRYISQICEVDKNSHDYSLYTHYDYYDKTESPSIDNIKSRRKLKKYEAIHHT